MSKWFTVDFAVEIFGSIKYYIDALRGKPGTRTTQSHPSPRTFNSRTGEGVSGPGRKMDFATAFGVYQPRAETDRKLRIDRGGEANSSSEAIRLAPYGYPEGSTSPDPEISAGG